AGRPRITESPDRTLPRHMRLCSRQDLPLAKAAARRARVAGRNGDPKVLNSGDQRAVSALVEERGEPPHLPLIPQLTHAAWISSFAARSGTSIAASSERAWPARESGRSTQGNSSGLLVTASSGIKARLANAARSS